MDFDITVAGGEEISVKGVFQDGLGDLTQQIKGEALKYINGSKRKQGDLFERQGTIVGSVPSEADEKQEQKATESDFRFEEERLEAEKTLTSV